jgi:hypothetical protein
VQFLQLAAHRHAQLGVEVGRAARRRGRPADRERSPAHRDALALAARKLARVAIEERREREDLGGAADLLVDRRLVLLRQHQREGEVLAHRHVRIERVVLEHHRDVALFRRNVVDAALADADLARADLLEARDHAQQRRLAASRRADQHGERAVGDVDVDAVQDGGLAEALLDRLDRDACHGDRKAAETRADEVSATPSPAAMRANR